MSKKPPQAKPNEKPTPNVRSLQEIQQEYHSVCLQLGSELHRLEGAPQRMDRMKERLRELDIEGEQAMRHLELEQKNKAEEERLKAEKASKEAAQKKA
jgi:hypothetical protein